MSACASARLVRLLYATGDLLLMRLLEKAAISPWQGTMPYY
jgi:hypothetical protein